MARLGCRCGAEMTNTISPSKSTLNIFYIQEALDAINSNPDIRLWDFYTGWDEKNKCNNSFQEREEPVEYWFCTNCKRVYEVQAKSCGKITKVYSVNEENRSFELDTSSLTELLILTDTEMDELLTKDENLTLKKYLDQNASLKAYISADKWTVYVRDIKSNSTIVYLREDINNIR